MTDTIAATAERFAARRERYETTRPGFSRNTAWVAAVIDALHADPAHTSLPDEQITALEIDGHPVTLADFVALHKEMTALHQQLDSTIKDRDAAQDAADKLAYAIAPADVIGEHGADDPWRNSLELLWQRQRSHAAGDQETDVSTRHT